MDTMPPELPPLDCEIEGYAWVPRMLAKARLTLAGEQGPWLFGCPVDHTCMARLGVRPELILELAGRHEDDHDVLAALREHGIPPASEQWFDGEAVEDELQATGHYLRVRPADALAATTGTEEHPVDEVVVVTAGAATFFLGERQARTVVAGEAVRIPAGVPHRVAPQPGFAALSTLIGED